MAKVRDAMEILRPQITKARPMVVLNERLSDVNVEGCVIVAVVINVAVLRLFLLFETCGHVICAFLRMLCDVRLQYRMTDTSMGWLGVYILDCSVRRLPSQSCILTLNMLSPSRKKRNYGKFSQKDRPGTKKSDIHSERDELFTAKEDRIVHTAIPGSRKTTYRYVVQLHGIIDARAIALMASWSSCVVGSLLHYQTKTVIPGRLWRLGDRDTGKLGT